MSPASYRAAPPRVGSANTSEVLPVHQIHAMQVTEVKNSVNYLRDCAAIAAAIADLSRSCARPYAAKSPLASAACPSAIACFALRSADARSDDADDVLLDVDGVT
ncbi:MAG: hypothetical protein RL560_711, partial [Actinomycetota bacterium]